MTEGEGGGELDEWEEGGVSYEGEGRREDEEEEEEDERTRKG